MDNKAQSALEYLMTYGWALVVIAIIIAALVFLLGQSTTALNCTMSPAAGALGYVDHTVSSDGNLTLLLRNDSGASIKDVNATFSGDFGGAVVSLGSSPISSAGSVSISRTASTTVGSGATYNGVVTLAYNRGTVRHTAIANCTGRQQ